MGSFKKKQSEYVQTEPVQKCRVYYMYNKRGHSMNALAATDFEMPAVSTDDQIADEAEEIGGESGKPLIAVVLEGSDQRVVTTWR